MTRALIAMLAALAVSAAIMPLVIMLSRKLKVRQTVLSYVDNHLGKSGTPTMGGIGVLIALSVSCLCLMGKQHGLMLVTLFVTVGYGLIGFIDDFIKVFFKQNKGLSPLQKLIFQLLIAVIVAVYAYNNEYIMSSVFVPFTLEELSLGFFAVPFYALVFLAFTNAVNLTDGLDGLAGRVTVNYTLFFAALICVVMLSYDGQAVSGEYESLLVYCGGLIGALIGFLCYNGFPAKIFMGDTGALALGGGLACLAVVSKLSLMVPILGIMYVLTSLSVILQVAYYKLTKKRIFLMAPLHHHFERKGAHENSIVSAYTAVTFFVGLLSLIITVTLL